MGDPLGSLRRIRLSRAPLGDSMGHAVRRRPRRLSQHGCGRECCTASCSLVDLGLLLVLALLHRSMSRGMLRHVVRRSIPPRLERSTQAWAAAAGLAWIYAGWQPLPEILWSASGAAQWALSALFYLAWTLIMIGAFLACHLDVFELTLARDVVRPATDTLRQPLYCGVLVAVWATRVMTVGHLLLAGTVTVVPVVRRVVGGAQERRRARAARCPLIRGQAPRALAHDRVPGRR